MSWPQHWAKRGVELVSTGGTSKLLKQNGLKVLDVSELTGFPEMMDGRIKTLHPKVHGGLLAIRGNEAHRAAQQSHQIGDIDLLVVNLYPFEATLVKGAGFDEAIENIDIGGPAMIRAAAKNHEGVTVIVDKADYASLLGELESHKGATCAKFRRKCAAKAYARTAAYDAAISNWFAAEIGEQTPKWVSFSGELQETLRYGENPHQWAAFYQSSHARPGVATAEQIQGKALSYNNLNDTDAAFELVAEIDPKVSAAVAIIKHANPCGAAMGGSLREAYARALKCDPVSAFGGIVALNQTLDAEVAREITKIFTEVVIAPDATQEAREIMGGKKNIRLLITAGLPNPRSQGVVSKMLSSGFLLQARDNGCVEDLDLQIVSDRRPNTQEMDDLKFAFKVCKHVKSNGIVYVKDGATVGHWRWANEPG